MSDNDSRDLPDRPSLRHLKLEAKRRLAAGEFTTLHDAQLAVAREHGMSSWAALKERVTAAEAERSPALARVRWLIGRYAGAGLPGWAAPARDELAGHFTERFLGFVSPDAIAQTLETIADGLREELVVLDADATQLSAKAGNLRLEAAVEDAAPHRLDTLRFFFASNVTVTDARAAEPPTVTFGPVPEPVPSLISATYGRYGLAGLTASGDGASGDGGGRAWTCSRGWADIEGNLPLGSGQQFPVGQLTMLVTATVVLSLVADGAIALDDPVNRQLRSLRLTDDTVTVREVLAHVGGVDSPPQSSLWADSVLADVAGVLGPVVGCSGPRGQFALSNGGYAVLGQLAADRTGTPFAQAATERVLEPLRLADSWFPARTPVSPDAVTSYQLTEAGSFEPEPQRVCTLPGAGGLWSTGPDLARFGAGWRALLPAELAAEALRPHVPGRDAAEQTGLGWGLRPAMDAAGLAAAGPGFAASLIMRPSTGRTVVALTNRMFPVLALNIELAGAVGS